MDGTMLTNEIRALRVTVQNAETGKVLLENTSETICVVMMGAAKFRPGIDKDEKGIFSVQGNLGKLALAFAKHPSGQKIVQTALDMRSVLEEMEDDN